MGRKGRKRGAKKALREEDILVGAWDPCSLGKGWRWGGKGEKNNMMLLIMFSNKDGLSVSDLGFVRVIL